jgi:carboxylesterase
MDYLDRWARPFLFTGGNEACLLIHGFTGTPSHMRYLGQFLHYEADYTVKAPLLPGHGTSLEDMEKTGQKDWLAASEQAYQKLVQRYEKVHVIGYSMGGVLALLLAEKYEVDRLVTIAAPVKFQTKLVYLAPLLKHFMRFKSWQQETKRDRYDVRYSGFPVRCLEELVKLVRKMKKKIAEVNSPLLVVQSRQDGTVNPASADWLYKHVSSEERDILWLEESGHDCPISLEREKIHQRVLNFLAE